MTNEQSLRVLDLSTSVDQLLRSFGVRATLKAMILGVLRRQRDRNAVSHLSAHMRRDIGLPVRKPLPGEDLIPPWLPRF